MHYIKARSMQMQSCLHITGGKIIDPFTSRTEIADVFVENGIFVDRPSVQRSRVKRISARGMLLLPGLMDIHVHFREPGNERAENITSGSRAAAAGGFTTVVMMPNTVPPLDTPESIRRVINKARRIGLVNVVPSGCLTRDRRGKIPADFPALLKAGAGAVTDDGSTVPDRRVMKKIMLAAQQAKVTVLDHAMDASMAGLGAIRAGTAARRLKVPGIPAGSESSMVRRDIELSRETRCRIHIQHVSESEAVRLIRRAQRQAIPVTGEATPHHLALTVDDIKADDAMFKMNPPLGTRKDRENLIQGIADGTISALATDHAPHRMEDKARGLKTAPFGIIGLETAAALTFSLLVKTGVITIEYWTALWTVNPAAILGLPPPTIQSGYPASFLLFDPSAKWTIDPSRFLSLARNTPFGGMRVSGMPVRTFYCGRMTYSAVE
jgi:dihydroorotase